MQYIKKAAPQLPEFMVKYYLNNTVRETNMEIVTAAFGMTALQMVTSSSLILHSNNNFLTCQSYHGLSLF